MSIFKRAPTTVPALSKAVAATIKKGDYGKIGWLLNDFLRAPSPDKVMELYWACFDDEVLRKDLIGPHYSKIATAVKSLGSQVVGELLTGLTDWDNKDIWSTIKSDNVIQLLGEMGAMSAFQPILQVSLKSPPRYRGVPMIALGNLRLANAAEWKKLALTCTEEEKQHLMGAGALSIGMRYEEMTNLEWQDEFYLPGEDRYGGPEVR